jgi:hypothetical protein
MHRGIWNHTIFVDICWCFFLSVWLSYFRLSLKTAWSVNDFFFRVLYVSIRGKWQSGIFGVCLGRRGNLKAHDRIWRMWKTTTLTNCYRSSTIMAPCFAACCLFLHYNVYLLVLYIYIGLTLSAWTYVRRIIKWV